MARLTLPPRRDAATPVARTALVAVGAFALATLVGGTAHAGGAQTAYIVVVHRDAPTALPRDGVARLFLKKASRWPDGTPASPVDLPATAPARGAFSSAVLGRSVASVRAYWQAELFQGRDTPPPEKADGSAVLEHVRTVRGALGYVPRGTELPAGVHALEVTP